MKRWKKTVCLTAMMIMLCPLRALAADTDALLWALASQTALAEVPDLAVRNAYEAYRAAGFGPEEALERVKAHEGEITAAPASIPAIVAQDLAAPMIPVDTGGFTLDLQARKVHLTSCPKAQEIPATGKIHTSLGFSELEGFAACELCHPDQAVIPLEMVVQRAYAAYIELGLTREQAMAMLAPYFSYKKVGLNK